MKVAIFAHFDKANVIEEYVIYYLNELKKVSNKIIFVSDCELSNKEKEKISNIADTIIAKHHGEYDFGSYKYGYLYAKENNLLEDCNELIFANDSCFGPLKPFDGIFKEMQNKKCDFWGITKNGPEYPDHIQSYFVVYKENVFKTPLFHDFISNIKKEDNKQDIINKYEIGLSQHLLKNGFNFQTYYNDEIPQSFHKVRFYKKTDIPMLKKHMLNNIFNSVVKKYIKKFLTVNNYNYPLDYIVNYHSKNSNPDIRTTLKNVRRIILCFSLKKGYLIFKEKEYFFKKQS